MSKDTYMTRSGSSPPSEAPEVTTATAPALSEGANPNPVCCLCAGPIADNYGNWGNNPYPLAPDDDHHRCCLDCDRTRVLPARLQSMRAKAGPSITAEEINDTVFEIFKRIENRPDRNRDPREQFFTGFMEAIEGSVAQWCEDNGVKVTGFPFDEDGDEGDESAVGVVR